MIGSNFSYADLLHHYAPRPTMTEDEYDRIQALIDELLEAKMLSKDEKTFLNLLGSLIEEYEAENLPDLELRGIELLKALIAEMGLKQKDLVPIFKTDSIVSAVLNGQRKLTVEHISKLSSYFKMPHGHFFERDEIILV